MIPSRSSATWARDDVSPSVYAKMFAGDMVTPVFFKGNDCDPGRFYRGLDKSLSRLSGLDFRLWTKVYYMAGWVARRTYFPKKLRFFCAKREASAREVKPPISGHHSEKETMKREHNA